MCLMVYCSVQKFKIFSHSIIFWMCFPHVRFIISFVSKSFPARRNWTRVQVYSFVLRSYVSIQLKFSPKTLSTFGTDELINSLVFFHVFGQADFMHVRFKADLTFKCFASLIVFRKDVSLMRGVGWRFLATVRTVKNLCHLHIVSCTRFCSRLRSGGRSRFPNGNPLRKDTTSDRRVIVI